jgi:hypothetical protein
MKRLLGLGITFALFIIGCGGGSTTTSSTGSTGSTTTAMQNGQWEFTLGDLFLEANIVDSGSTVNSTVFNTSLYKNGGAIGGLFSDCSNIEINATISGNELSGNVISPGASSTFGTLSGVLASNGQSVTNGSYSGGSCAFDSGTTNASLTGYIVTPLNGTFSGVLNSNKYGADQTTITISQSNFGITASGTSTENGVTTAISITPDGTATDNTGGYSNVIGATCLANGTATNVNGSTTFQAFGHFNAAGTQIEVEITDSQTGELNTGTLTKQ